jgi:hypothetical protein
MPISVATLQAQYLSEFISSVKLEVRNHRWDLPNTIVAELTALATALGTDPTVHDTTQQTAPTATKPGLIPGAASGRTKFMNDVLLHVNQGKNYGQAFLTNAQMGTAITAALSNILPPTISVAPVVSGTGTVGNTLTTTNGTWNFSPSGFTYQWLRNGAAIAGATASTYKLVAADSTTNVGCMVTASNPAGFGSAMSNVIAVA